MKVKKVVALSTPKLLLHSPFALQLKTVNLANLKKENLETRSSQAG